MPAEQTFTNHTRFDPPYHFLLAPIFLINLFVVIGFGWKTFHVEPFLSLWRVVVALGLLLIVGLSRSYALRVQNRVIRLEEQLRIAALRPIPSAGDPRAISMEQFIALRFASDEEAPALARRAATENLSPNQIKEAVQNWKPDLHRV